MLALLLTAALATLQGTVRTPQGEPVPGLTVTVRWPRGTLTIETDRSGRFAATVPPEALTLAFEGRGIAPLEVKADHGTRELAVTVTYLVPPIHETVVIVAQGLDPGLDRRNDAVYKNTLLSRDDQLLHTLDAGINAGQHEGGGKSLEVRRFGFNLDHGGVGGGLKVLVDDVQQNQGTQGHGQGYLGALKGVTPELIEDVDVLNGPFSAQYGDFSGLGVVHIRLRESLPEALTLRLQAGSFDSGRVFAAWSPRGERATGFLAYEGSRTDGPFENPLDYGRDNVTANLTLRLGEQEALGFRLNTGRNDFTSSGQIPLDEVEAGRLDPFGFVDPDNGGRVRAGTLAAYYRRPLGQGTLKLDAFATRSLFDLWSNFTFFLSDRVNGDEVQQHDSRLMEGASAQYLRPHRVLGLSALLMTGFNVHDNHIDVALFPSTARRATGVTTDAHAALLNVAGYVQEGALLLGGRLHAEAGLRYDLFRFAVDDRVDPTASGRYTSGRLQPKASLRFRPSLRVPLSLHLNYGRGISSQDARGVVRETAGPRIATTDFYQVGLSSNHDRFSAAADLFLIDRSNEQVYVPDDGRIEFAGPSRSYGFEIKASARIAGPLALNAGLTRVMNAFYRGTEPRIYVDSAPHAVGNASLTLADWRGLLASLRYRHVSRYRLDGEDAAIRASGLDVVDVAFGYRIGRRVTLNLAIDNLSDRTYYETQNYFESRLTPDAAAASRIHATPGYPRAITAGVTIRAFGK